jgi:ABC-type oligopeptide transport system ATPase subunit
MGPSLTMFENPVADYTRTLLAAIPHFDLESRAEGRTSPAMTP